MPQANPNSAPSRLYVASDFSRAFRSEAEAVLSSQPLVIDLPADSARDLGGSIIFAADSDGDSIFTPFPADVADWAIGRSGVVLRHVTVQ